MHRFLYLVVVMGLPGRGKPFFARQLAAHLSAVCEIRHVLLMDSQQFDRMVADSGFLERELPENERDFEIVETHISYVILTRRRAYKIKKSVKLSFMDFSNLGVRTSVNRN